jgi:hypothetical protein
MQKEITLISMEHVHGYFYIESGAIFAGESCTRMK